MAVRLIADREKEIRAFVSEEYWRITATRQPRRLDGARPTGSRPSWPSGEGAKFAAKNEAEAQTIRDALASAPYVVSKVEEVEKLDRADAPFKTSTLQQQAAIRLRFSGKRTMKVAQELYEGIDVDGDGPGRPDHLHAYRQPPRLGRGARRRPRPDPGRVRRAVPARQAEPLRRRQEGPGGPRGDPADRPEPDARDRSGPRSATTSSSSTADLPPVRRQPDDAGRLRRDQRRDHGRAEGLFKTQGKILKFDGYRRSCRRPASRRTRSCRHSRSARRSTCSTSTPTQHFTQPPPRYNEATLIKALEKENIGRPSTYAPIIQTIQDRLYVEQKERRFFATDLGMVVTDLLVKHFPKIMDLKFTAHMEDELDDIATAKEDMVKVLDEFYHPFQEALKAAETQMERVQVPSSARSATSAAPRWCVKFSRTGPVPRLLEVSRVQGDPADRTASRAPRPSRPSTRCPKCGKPLLHPREQAAGRSCRARATPSARSRSTSTTQGNPVPSRGRDRARLREVRQADGPAPGLARAVPGLHRLPQVPQHDAGRRRGQAGRRRSRST